MIGGLRICLADWRDRERIQPLRRATGSTFDGGLYELLNWPIYHVHLALQGDQPLGYTAVLLLADGHADDLGTHVVPEVRRQGLASALRAVQARDLMLMGWSWLWTVGSDDPAAAACLRSHFGAPIGAIGDQPYHGVRCEVLHGRLMAKGVAEPHPLSPANAEKLRRKAERAHAQLAQLAQHGRLNLQKARLRETVDG